MTTNTTNSATTVVVPQKVHIVVDYDKFNRKRMLIIKVFRDEDKAKKFAELYAYHVQTWELS